MDSVDKRGLSWQMQIERLFDSYVDVTTSIYKKNLQLVIKEFVNISFR